MALEAAAPAAPWGRRAQGPGETRTRRGPSSASAAAKAPPGPTRAAGALANPGHSPQGRPGAARRLGMDEWGEGGSGRTHGRAAQQAAAELGLGAHPGCGGRGAGWRLAGNPELAR